MEWYREERNAPGSKQEVEGYYLNSPQKDWKKLIRCKKCGNETKIEDCEKNHLVETTHGCKITGEFRIECPNCNNIVARLRLKKHTLNKLVLRRGEVVDPPEENKRIKPFLTPLFFVLLVIWIIF